MRDKFDGVQIFVEAVEAGGFARAADRLSLSRSAVGKAVARLEERLGVRLFQRTTRTQSLTEAGQQFYEHCLRAVAELRTGEALLESGRQEVAGRLRISMPVLLGRRCAAPILIDYAKAHPKLELELNFSDRVIDLIADGFDLGLRFGALGNNSSLRARRLVTERMVLCAAPSYLDARGRPEELADLAGHDALAYARGDRGYVWRLPDAGGVLVPVSPHARLRFDDVEVILAAAKAGLGLCWLAHWLIRDSLQAGELVQLWADRPYATMDCYAVWPAARYLPLRSRLAIDALASRMPRDDILHRKSRNSDAGDADADGGEALTGDLAAIGVEHGGR
ncbi:LysR family transcriptional regulator [Methylobacterium sp. Leaf93]|uniref:LysR family transcriptional regulator n=1 Tax=Methylobacterium sp. Leaf93 TaxID=1736249 RepID=UPI0006F661B1|nr:LysR family transcriptional regulator [Methylobacterium sp. Leaf93]KQP02740.1 LysR family transcriptional regulator [Methylobacterium sp. Leaf93]